MSNHQSRGSWSDAGVWWVLTTSCILSVWQSPYAFSYAPNAKHKTQARGRTLATTHIANNVWTRSCIYFLHNHPHIDGSDIMTMVMLQLVSYFNRSRLGKNKYHPLYALSRKRRCPRIYLSINTCEPRVSVWRTNSFVFMLILCTENVCGLVKLCVFVCVVVGVGCMIRASSDCHWDSHHVGRSTLLTHFNIFVLHQPNHHIWCWVRDGNTMFKSRQRWWQQHRRRWHLLGLLFLHLIFWICTTFGWFFLFVFFKLNTITTDVASKRAIVSNKLICEFHVQRSALRSMNLDLVIKTNFIYSTMWDL